MRACERRLSSPWQDGQGTGGWLASNGADAPRSSASAPLRRAAHLARYAAMVRSMDDSERTILESLQNQDLGDVVYEPDGNVPPDFLVNGRIAVEVRRLNENVETDEGHRGLEEISKPLNVLVRKAL